MFPKGVLQLSQLCKGGHWHDKKYYPTSQDLLLISLFSYLAQNPACP